MAGFEVADNNTAPQADSGGDNTSGQGGLTSSDDALLDEYFKTSPVNYAVKTGGDIDVHYGDDRYENGLAYGLTRAAESLQTDDVQRELEGMNADKRRDMLEAMRAINQDNYAQDEHVPLLTLTETEEGLDITSTYKNRDIFGKDLEPNVFSDSIALTDKGEASPESERLYRGFRPEDYARAAQSGQTHDLALALQELTPQDKVKFLSEIEAANRAHHAVDPSTPVVEFQVSEGVKDVTLTLNFESNDRPFVAKVGH